jgi:hypothetical protein
MDTQRFFLKAAGISLAKVAGISLALVMAFAMFAGCEQDTKIVYRTPESTDPGTSPGTQQPVVTKEDALRKALTTPTGKPIYVIGAVTLTAPLEIPSGYEVYVLGTSSEVDDTTGTVVKSAGGPLFAAVSGNGSITTGGFELIVRSRATLVALNASAVTVASNGKLTVEEDGTLAVGAAGGVVVAPYADMHLEKNAILYVSNDPGLIVVQKADDGSYGKLTDEGSKVAIAGIDDSATVALYDSVTEGSGAEAVTTLPIISIPTGVPANISDEVKVYASIEDAETGGTSSLTEVNKEVQKQAEAASEGSPERTTKDANTAEGFLAAADTTTTTVTYTGDTAFSSAITATGKTLIIKGKISGQNAAISVGTLEIAEGASLALSGAGPITVTTKLVNDGTLDLGTSGSIAGEGAVQNSGTIKTGNGTDFPTLLTKATGAIELSGAVTVAADKTLTIPNGTTLTIASSGKLTVAAGTLPLGKVTIASGGTLVYAAAATVGELNGELEVASGGTFIDKRSGGGSLWGNSASGTITWNAGAKGYVGGDTATDLRIGGPNDSDTTTLIKLTSGTLKNKKDGYELEGNATVRGNYGINNMTFTIKEKAAEVSTPAVPSTLTVQLMWKGHDASSTYTGPYGVWLLGTSKIVGSGDAVIEIKAPTSGITDGLIHIDSTATNNFYDNSALPVIIATPIPADTYTWVATLNGGGWKATKAATDINPNQETAVASEVATLLAKDGVEKVTYTGTGTLGAINAPGKTLIITKAIAQTQTEPITVGTLSITTGGTLTTSASGSISTTTLTNSGVLTSSGSISATALEIASGSLTTTGASAVIIAPTLTNNGVLTAGAPITTTGTLENTGVLTTSGTTGVVISAATLTNSGVLTSSGSISATTLTIENSGSLTTNTANAIINATTLNNSGVLTTSGATGPAIILTAGTLTNNGSATVDLGANGTITGPVTNSGIVITSTTTGGTLATILANVAGSISATGASISLPAGTTTVRASTTLTVGGTLSISGSGGNLVVEDEGNIIVEGTLIHESGSTAELDGTITVEATGTYKDLNSGGNTVWGTGGKDGGSIIFNKGAKAYVGTDTVAMISDVATAANALVLIQLEANNTTFKLEKAKYTLDGDAVVHGEFWVSAGTEIALEEGSTLTVSVSWSPLGTSVTEDYPGLWLNGADAKITGDTDAQIIVTTVSSNNRNALYLKPAATHNFYDSDNDKIEANATPNTKVGEGTYKWTENVSGSDSGWKKQADV